MNDRALKAHRSTSEIRESLDTARRQIEEDLETLGERLQASMNPLRQLGRHPILIAVAGAVFGFLLVKRPALLMRAAGRVARWGTPLVLSALLRSPAKGETTASEDAMTQEPFDAPEESPGSSRGMVGGK